MRMLAAFGGLNAGALGEFVGIARMLGVFMHGVGNGDHVAQGALEVFGLIFCALAEILIAD